MRKEEEEEECFYIRWRSLSINDSYKIRIRGDFGSKLNTFKIIDHD
jgi:hypothetical protein